MAGTIWCGDPDGERGRRVSKWAEYTASATGASHFHIPAATAIASVLISGQLQNSDHSVVAVGRDKGADMGFPFSHPPATTSSPLHHPAHHCDHQTLQTLNGLELSREAMAAALVEDMQIGSLQTLLPPLCTLPTCLLTRLPGSTRLPTCSPGFPSGPLQQVVPIANCPC